MPAKVGPVPVGVGGFAELAAQGDATSIGLTLVLPCDVRIASDDARLGIRFIYGELGTVNWGRFCSLLPVPGSLVLGGSR